MMKKNNRIRKLDMSDLYTQPVGYVNVARIINKILSYVVFRIREIRATLRILIVRRIASI